MSRRLRIRRPVSVTIPEILIGFSGFVVCAALLAMPWTHDALGRAAAQMSAGLF